MCGGESLLHTKHVVINVHTITRLCYGIMMRTLDNWLGLGNYVSTHPPTVAIVFTIGTGKEVESVAKD